MTNGERLRRIQVAGHARIDQVYQPLAEATEASVIRAGREQPTLAPFAVPLVLGDVRALIAAAEPALVGIIVATSGQAELAADSAQEPDAGALSLAGASATVSLARNRPQVLGQVAALLQRGISLALTPRQTGLSVRQYFAPWFSPRRSVTGGLQRAEHLGAIRSWPGQAGMASQHVRGVMLYESTAANTRGARRSAERDGQLLRYHVSHQHLEVDDCDVLERRDVGYGPGIYPPEAFPIVPTHVRCRCWAEPIDRPRFSAKREVA